MEVGSFYFIYKYLFSGLKIQKNLLYAYAGTTVSVVALSYPFLLPSAGTGNLLTRFHRKGSFAFISAMYARHLPFPLSLPLPFLFLLLSRRHELDLTVMAG